MDLGFIGLGSMGRGMAASLLKAGHRVRVWNRSPGPVEELRKLGAEPAASAAEAFVGDACFSMLADDAAVRHVIVPALPTGPVPTVHVNMATISVAGARELAQLHDQRGVPYLSAPVLGRPDAAAAGKLHILAAGDPAAIDRVQPALDAVGQKTWRLGDQPANANVVKIAVNFLLACAIEGMGEAAALVEAHGIAPADLIDLLTGTLFNAPVYKGYGSLIVSRQYEPAGFQLTLGLKDTRLALAASEGAHVPLPFAGILRDAFVDAIAHGDGRKDWSAVAEVSARRAGLR